MFALSLQLMFYGLIGVFMALGILYIAVNSLTWIFPQDVESEE
jgi:Na+-transporting methylmalonyl-CoA/oxaloacetate decarboxylase gamma subunit